MQTRPVRSSKSCDIYPLILKLSIKHNQSVFSFQKTSLNPPTEILGCEHQTHRIHFCIA